MTQATRTESSWDERLARAAELSQKYGFAAEALRFYREIAIFQRSLERFLHSCEYAPVGRASRLAPELDLYILLPKLPPFLSLVQSVAPAELAEAARQLENRGPQGWTDLLAGFWQTADADDIAPGEHCVAQAFLQPLAEYLAALGDFERGSNYAKPFCPFCGRKPVLGTLRPEGDGARRSLVCSLCATEWQFRRVVCPACGETDVEKLPVYTADEFEHVRVESCDTCKTFIKTVDLSRNGRANPIVDELATIPLTIWAQEKGYTKLQTNLLGM